MNKKTTIWQTQEAISHGGHTHVLQSRRDMGRNLKPGTTAYHLCDLEDFFKKTVWASVSSSLKDINACLLFLSVLWGLNRFNKALSLVLAYVNMWRHLTFLCRYCHPSYLNSIILNSVKSVDVLSLIACAVLHSVWHMIGAPWIFGLQSCSVLMGV